MKKMFVWLQLAIYLPYIWINALQSRKLSFADKFKNATRWAKLVAKKMGVEMSTAGAENIPTDETVYFISNHQGSLDPFIILSTIPVPTTAVSKLENSKIPFISSWFKTLEVIWLDRSSLRNSLKMIDEVVAALKSGQNVVAFPEGTRSKSATMGEFKAGALKPAFLAQCTVVPIALINTFVIDAKGKQDKKAKVVYCEPLKYESFKDLTTVELSNKIVAIIQEELDGGI